MMMMEALAARLKEPPFGELSVKCVDLRFSRSAARDLLRELDNAGYVVWSMDEIWPMPNGRESFLCKDVKAKRGFEFSVDKRLPGKSFVVRLRK